MRRTLFATVSTVAVLGLLTACSGTSDDAGTSEAPTAEATVTATPDPDTGITLDLTAGATDIGLPSGVSAPTDASAGAMRTDEDGLIAVFTFGSSTCPQVPDSLASGADGAITVSFPEPTDGPCTLDYVPASTVVALPDGGDTGGDLTVTLGDFGTVTLPAGSTDAEWVTAG